MGRLLCMRHIGGDSKRWLSNVGCCVWPAYWLGWTYTQGVDDVVWEAGMLMKLKRSGALVEVKALNELWDPYAVDVLACVQRGEEAQDAEPIDKQDLCFLSGEPIPCCWRDPHYRDSEWQPHMAEGADLGISNYFGA